MMTRLQLLDLVGRHPFLPSVGDVTVLDPSRLGRPWRLHEAPIRHVVLLDGPGADHPYMTHVGAGWAFARLLRGGAAHRNRMNTHSSGPGSRGRVEQKGE